MSNHKTTIIDERDKHRAICTCRAQSSSYDHRWEAQDWEFSHLNLVERVRTHLSHGKTPSLKSQRDYYREKEVDPNTPKDDRVWWKQWADELDHRLNDAVLDDSPGLW